MKLQYSTPSVRVNGNQRGVRGVRWQNGLTIPFGDTAARFIQENMRFVTSPVIARKLGLIVLLTVSVSLVCAFTCSSLINSTEVKTAQIVEQKAAVEMTNISLLAKRAMTWGPDNMEKLAKEKLALMPAKKEQVGVYDRRLGTFRY